eukprot:gene8773-biopygen9765
MPHCRPLRSGGGRRGVVEQRRDAVEAQRRLLWHGRDGDALVPRTGEDPKWGQQGGPNAFPPIHPWHVSEDGDKWGIRPTQIPYSTPTPPQDECAHTAAPGNAAQRTSLSSYTVKPLKHGEGAPGSWGRAESGENLGSR